MTPALHAPDVQTWLAAAGLAIAVALTGAAIFRPAHVPVDASNGHEYWTPWMAFWWAIVAIIAFAVGFGIRTYRRRGI